MEYVGYLAEKIQILTATEEESKPVVSVAQAKSILPELKPPIPKAFKG